MAVKHKMYQHKVDVDMLNGVKSVHVGYTILVGTGRNTVFLKLNMNTVQLVIERSLMKRNKK